MYRHEGGQVLPLGLVLLVLCVAGTFMLFTTAQVSTDKMRLANAADAAAYSGALWQARALNFQAYANRAMVANQVAIGQAVSLQSWMTYAKVTSEHIATALKPVPVLNVVTTGVEEGVALAEKGVSIGAQTLLTVSNAATKALSVSQGVMQAATLANTAEIIHTVASETDSRFNTTSAYGLGNIAANATQWLAFNEYHTRHSKAGMKERQQLIMASRDAFTRSRNWDLFDFWVPSSIRTFHKLRRQGGTRLTAVDTPGGLEWEWMARDTLSIHNRIIKFLRTKKVELPVAWASAFANSNNTRRPLEDRLCKVTPVSGRFGLNLKGDVCRRYTRNNHRAEKFANRNQRSVKSRSRTLRPMWGYGGVRSFWVLSDEARAAEDARLTVRVEVSLPAAEVRDATDVVKSARMTNELVTAGSVLSSISAADVFYRHPQHHRVSASSREKANLYNPYWQVQLTPVGKVQKGLALAGRTGGTKPATRHAVASSSSGSSSSSGLGYYQGQ